jgi:hypothetical protein
MKLDNNDIVSKLDADIMGDILNCLASIYKINKEHRLFAKLLEEHTELSNAEYVVYPNLNSSLPTRFLNEDGVNILSYAGGVSEFILISLDIDFQNQAISIRNPFISELKENGSFSW